MKKEKAYGTGKLYVTLKVRLGVSPQTIFRQKKIDFQAPYVFVDSSISNLLFYRTFMSRGIWKRKPLFLQPLLKVQRWTVETFSFLYNFCSFINVWASATCLRIACAATSFSYCLPAPHSSSSLLLPPSSVDTASVSSDSSEILSSLLEFLTPSEPFSSIGSPSSTSSEDFTQSSSRISLTKFWGGQNPRARVTDKWRQCAKHEVRDIAHSLQVLWHWSKKQSQHRTSYLAVKTCWLQLGLLKGSKLQL